MVTLISLLFAKFCYKVVELTVGVLDVLKMLKNLERPLGGSMENSARTCKEIMQLNSSLPDGNNFKTEIL